ncbi:MAG TPA: hypothetical protein VFG79_17405 [Solirubrobacter sp.]|nr:hypothetical protein [Solirubrobacter sp.]
MRVHAQDPRRALRDPERDAVAGPGPGHALAVGLEQQRRRAVEHVHAQALLRVQEDRAVERGVRRDRRDQQPAVARRDDRPAGRERVRGRAGRGGDHQRVARVAREHLVLDLDGQRRGAVPGNARQRRVVERRQRQPGERAGDGHRRALLGAVVAVVDPVERGRQLVEVDLGEEREPPEVHTQHRHVVPGGELERAEDRPVAAEPDDQRTAGRQLLLAHGLDRRRHQVARLGEPAHDHAVPRGPAHDALDVLLAVAPRVDHDADGVASDHSSRCTLSGEKAGRQTATYSAPSGVE